MFKFCFLRLLPIPGSEQHSDFLATDKDLFLPKNFLALEQQNKKFHKHRYFQA